MIQAIAKMAETSPIQDALGDTKDPTSLLSRERNLHSQNSKNDGKFRKNVLEYVMEWESIVITRVDDEHKIVKQLREVQRHYQNKVEKLRNKTHALSDKGKSVSSSLEAKLDRNESKLQEASQGYESYAKRFAIMVEEVVQQGWRDLVPLVSRLMTLEMEFSKGHYEKVGNYASDLSQLEAQVDDLQDWKPPKRIVTTKMPEIESKKSEDTEETLHSTPPASPEKYEVDDSSDDEEGSTSDSSTAVGKE